MEQDKKAMGRIERWMMDALLALMEEKPFQEIRITEITARAQLARCTFYRYYKSKEELLLQYCRTVFQELGERMGQEDCHTFYGTARGYFSYWQGRRDFLELLRRNGLMHFMLQSYDEMMFDVAREVKPENRSMQGQDFSPKVRYHFFFGMAGFWSMMNRWVQGGCKESPEELAQYVVAYLVESYEGEPACQYYDQHKHYPFEPCYIKPGNEF